MSDDDDDFAVVRLPLWRKIVIAILVVFLALLLLYITGFIRIGTR